MGAKAVIIDHEPLMAAQLKKLLQQGKPAIEVKAICYEGEQAMACLAAHQPDIVFLTLEMPRVSGMIIAKQIEAELEYPGQIKVNVIRESRAVDYAK